MEEKGNVLPPAYETAYGISNPVHDHGAAGIPQHGQYGYPQGPYSGAPVITQQPMPMYSQVTQVPDNMTLAIVALFFCWPLALVAIMKASDSKAALARNDIPTAIADANDAKRYAYIGIGVGAVLVVAAIITMVVVFSSFSSYY